MVTMSKLALVGVGVAGTLFLAYCVYFDRKRRSQPDFRAKLRQKRKASKAKSEAPSSAETELPDESSRNLINEFMITHYALSEQFASICQFEAAGDYLASAFVSVGEPKGLLHVLKSVVADETYNELMKRLPEKRAQFEFLAQTKGFSLRQGVELCDDDVE